MDRGNTKLWRTSWGILAIVCAMTWAIWGAIVATVVLVLLIADIFFLSRWGKRVYRGLMLRKPFEVYYLPVVGNPLDSCNIDASPDARYFQFKLLIRNELSVLHVRFAFMGEGIEPKITKLYDWFRGEGIEGIVPSNVEQYPVEDGSSWYWNYHSPHPRTKGSSITIGAKCLAKDYFNGVLEFGVTFKEVTKVVQMRFVVGNKEAENK